MCQNGMQSEWEIHAWHSSVRGVCEYNNSNVILLILVVVVLGTFMIFI